MADRIIDRVIEVFSNVSFFKYVGAFTLFAIIISEILIVVQSYFLTGEFFVKNLLIVGFITPMIDAFIVSSLAWVLLRYIRKLKKQIEREKEEAENLYKQIIDNSNEFISWIKDDYTYGIVNKTYLDKFKLKESEIIGKTVSEIIGKEHFEEVSKPSLDRTLNGEVVHYETKTIIHGEEVFFNISYSPFKPNGKNIDGVILTGLDITKEVELQRKERKNEQILLQQSKLASMGEMIGAIAHQWRQPLNTLALTIQDVEDAYFFDELDEQYIKESSGKAMEQINYMSSTIDDFRSFFRQNQKDEVFSIFEVIEQSLKITQTGLLSKNIKLIKDCEKDLKVKGLKNQYVQVVINLIKNAQDALVEKSIENPFIKISLFEIDKLSLFQIEDNGGGIPEEFLEKIFEPYFTTKHQSVGTGLGLYMSKMIIEGNLHGQLKVKNTEKGAKFIIEAPIFSID
jgi:PAS domain S-box-containing protein